MQLTFESDKHLGKANEVVELRKSVTRRAPSGSAGIVYLMNGVGDKRKRAF